MRRVLLGLRSFAVKFAVTWMIAFGYVGQTHAFKDAVSGMLFTLPHAIVFSVCQFH